MQPGRRTSVPEGTVPMKRPRVLFLSAAAALAAATVWAQPAPRQPPSGSVAGGSSSASRSASSRTPPTRASASVGHVVFTPGGGPFGIRIQTGGLVYGSRKIAVSVPGSGRTGDRGPHDRQLAAQRRDRPPGHAPLGHGSSLRLRARRLRLLRDRDVARQRLRLLRGQLHDELRRHRRSRGRRGPACCSRSRGASRSTSACSTSATGRSATSRRAISCPRRADAPPVIVPRQTEANLVTITVGVSVRLLRRTLSVTVRNTGRRASEISS